MNRVPAFVNNTEFRVDTLHWHNHTGKADMKIFLDHSHKFQISKQRKTI